MLRAKSSGVAENSQHMNGKAMDVFIKGVKLSTLRAAAMKLPGRRRRLLPDLGQPLRPHGHRQRPRLAAHDHARS